MILAYHSPLSVRVRFVETMQLLILLALSVALLLSSGAKAQDIFGRIAGTISDPTGAAIPNARVTVTNQETKLARTVTADSRGFYVAPELPAGSYSVTAEEKGFKTLTKAANDLVAGARLTVDLTLPIGNTAESIEVTAVAETVNTISGEISRTIDSKQVQDTALNERN